MAIHHCHTLQQRLVTFLIAELLGHFWISMAGKFWRAPNLR
jgi:hypothetical protein